MTIIEFAIQGVPPGLLMRRFAEATQAGLQNPVKLTGKKKLSPEEEAEMSAYRLESGELCIPAHNLFESCCLAAAQHQVAGRGKATYKDLVKGGVLIEPQYLIFTDADGAALTKYEIDQRPVRVQRARIIRCRPLLREWHLRGTINILDDDMVPVEVMSSVLSRAGQVKGIGDYRPVYGRFLPTAFSVVG